MVTATERRRPAGGHMWLIAAALLAIPLCLDATSDPDLWWHLRTGQWIADHLAVPHHEMYSYTAASAPWVAHEWLSELLFWVTYRGVGLTGLAVVVGLITWSGVLALALLAHRRGASGFAIGAVLLLGAKALQPVAGTRPQMLTFALLCWTLLLLDGHLRSGGRRVWMLVPIFLVWANLHAGFAVGLGLLATALGGGVFDALLEKRLDRTMRRRLLTAALALALSASVALVNPNGVDLYDLALSGSTPVAHQLIQEWQRPDFTTLAMLPLGLLIVATFAAMVVRRRRLLPSHVLLAVVGTAAALLAVRNIALAVALLSPTLATLFPVDYRLPARPRLLQVVALAAAAAVVLASGVRLALSAGDAEVARIFSACLLADLRSATVPVRLWLPYGQGGFAINAAWPRAHVYAYGEDTVLGPRVIIDYVRIAAGTTSEPRALDLLGASGTNAVITPAGALGTQLTAAGWRPVAEANGETLFVNAVGVAEATSPCPAG